MNIFMVSSRLCPNLCFLLFPTIDKLICVICAYFFEQMKRYDGLMKRATAMAKIALSDCE